MKPRERVHAALQRKPVDRTPRCEIWIDALLAELGQPDTTTAHANLGQDAVMLPHKPLPGSNAWGTGVDEWGRVWRGGIYTDGVVDTAADLARFSPDPGLAGQLFDEGVAADLRRRYPDHCLIYGTHIGPFMAATMAMGFQRLFLRLMDDPGFVGQLLDRRTDWAIAQFRQAVALGAEVIIVGDDAAHRGGPMISPALWREFILPRHRRLAASLDVPVIWHSDGDIRPLLPLAVEAGFAGIHGLEPAAGIDLAAIGRDYGDRLALIGNIDVNVLCAGDLAAVRHEVDRCLAQGRAAGNGHMISTCNSIFPGMNPAAVRELFRYLQQA